MQTATVSVLSVIWVSQTVVASALPFPVCPFPALASRAPNSPGKRQDDQYGENAKAEHRNPHDLAYLSFPARRRHGATESRCEKNRTNDRVGRIHHVNSMGNPSRTHIQKTQEEDYGRKCMPLHLARWAMTNHSWILRQQCPSLQRRLPWRFAFSHRNCRYCIRIVSYREILPNPWSQYSSTLTRFHHDVYSFSGEHIVSSHFSAWRRK